MSPADPSQDREDRIRLSVVLPVDDAGGSISQRLRAIEGVLSHHAPGRCEVLLIDDTGGPEASPGLTDITRSDRSVLLLRNPAACGAGYSARHGILLSRGERILLALGEPASAWQNLERMQEEIDHGAEFVVTADHRGGRGPWVFHLYDRDAAREIYGRQRIDGGGFALEALYLARRYGFTTLEIGLTAREEKPWGRRERPGSGCRLGELLRIRYHWLRGDYG